MYNVDVSILFQVIIASLKTTETNKQIVLIKILKREVLIKRLKFGSSNDFKNNTV